MTCRRLRLVAVVLAAGCVLVTGAAPVSAAQPAPVPDVVQGPLAPVPDQDEPAPAPGQDEPAQPAPGAAAGDDDPDAAQDPDGGGEASPAPMPDDPPADPPPSDAPDEELADPPEFPEGEFTYDAEHQQVWESLCGPDGWKENIAGDSEALAEWYSFQEANENYDCGQKTRSATSALSNAIGGDVFSKEGVPIANAADCMVDHGAWNHVDRKGFAMACSTVMSLTVTVTGAALKLVEWSFDFDVADAFGDVSQRLGQSFAWEMWGDGQSGLYGLAMFATTVLLGYRAMRGRVGHALVEFGFSIALLAVFMSTVVMAPNGFADLTRKTITASTSMAAGIADITLAAGGTGSEECGGSPAVEGPIGPGGMPGGDRQVFNDGTLSCQISQALTDALVMRPYDLVNWGETIGETGRCADARNEILETGPHGGDDTPRFLMGAAGCEDMADFNHDPAMTRLALAIAALFVAIITTILIVILSVTLIIAQLMLVVAVIALPWVMIFAIYPSTRHFLWSWVGHVLHAAVVVIVVAGVLSFMLMALSVSYAATEGSPWIVQAGTPIVLAFMGLFMRRRAIDHASSFAQRAKSGIASAAPGTSSAGGAVNTNMADSLSGDAKRTAARTYRAGTQVRNTPGAVRERVEDRRDRKAMAHGYQPVTPPPAGGMTRSARYRKQRRARTADRAARRKASTGRS